MSRQHPNPALASMFQTLERRRHDLQMSFATLATRSGVSMPTVVRILSGRHAAPALDNVAAIAAALGLTIEFAATESAERMRMRQAKDKAAALVGMVQGTSGLEGQGLDAPTLRQLRRRTERELLAGSKRNLW